jgi:hypothetical protein
MKKPNNLSENLYDLDAKLNIEIDESGWVRQSNSTLGQKLDSSLFDRLLSLLITDQSFEVTIIKPICAQLEDDLNNLVDKV